MLRLKQMQPIGRGTNRACFVHPEKADRCIKVTVSGDPSESERERYYYALLEQKHVSWDHLARFYGTIETDLGTGYLFELPRDYDGEISKTLHYYLNTADSFYIDDLFLRLRELFAYLLANRIVVKDINVLNILYQRTGQTQGRLVIIDGLGNSRRVSYFASRFSAFARWKTLRRWKEFETTWPRKIRRHPRYIDQLERFRSEER